LATVSIPDWERHFTILTQVTACEQWQPPIVPVLPFSLHVYVTTRHDTTPIV